ncbi:hypothetical protein DMC30DRAFT_393375 [Rhodotorula diobovata]|uniref:Uncharacterized protein n=1 Tax=Rhodotorula diobovata TaxID=5288 RepID=A0A5C5FYV1_9BASI|nr:hypothetical protein DMC30DRAFT_393375 [Rhodotorula diobovata]
MGPGAKRPRVSGGMGSGGGVTGRASPAAAPAAAAVGTPTPTVASAASTYVQHTPPVAALAGPTTGGGGLAAPPAPAAAAAAAAPAPALTPQQQQQVATPLGRYLCDISPAFIPHLSAFNANGIPLSTQPSDLLDLDSGAADDHEIFNTFRDVRALSPFLVALAADGTRKAKRRQLEGATADVDPRIAVGLQKLNAERWVRLKIAEGLQVQAQARAQAQAQAGDGAGQA